MGSKPKAPAAPADPAIAQEKARQRSLALGRVSQRRSASRGAASTLLTGEQRETLLTGRADFPGVDTEVENLRSQIDGLNEAAANRKPRLDEDGNEINNAAGRITRDLVRKKGVKTLEKRLKDREESPEGIEASGRALDARLEEFRQRVRTRKGSSSTILTGGR